MQVQCLLSGETSAEGALRRVVVRRLVPGQTAACFQLVLSLLHVDNVKWMYISETLLWPEPWFWWAFGPNQTGRGISAFIEANTTTVPSEKSVFDGDRFSCCSYGQSKTAWVLRIAAKQWLIVSGQQGII